VLQFTSQSTGSSLAGKACVVYSLFLKALYQGTALAVPLTLLNDEGFSPCLAPNLNKYVIYVIQAACSG
jgi:hypothetical protein